MALTEKPGMLWSPLYLPLLSKCCGGQVEHCAGSQKVCILVSAQNCETLGRLFHYYGIPFPHSVPIIYPASQPASQPKNVCRKSICSTGNIGHPREARASILPSGPTDSPQVVQNYLTCTQKRVIKSWPQPGRAAEVW